MFGQSPVPDWLQQPEQAMPPVNVAPSMMQTGQVKQKRGGMFGSGLNAGEVIVNLLNGALAAQGNPVGIANIKMMHDAYAEKQRRAQEEAQYQQHRGDELTDYGKKLQLQSQYKSHEPSDFQQYAVEGGYVPGTPEYAALMKRKADAMANPIVMTAYGPMPYSAVAGGGQQGSPAPKPLTDDDILRMQGGPAAPPPATFPRSY